MATRLLHAFAGAFLGSLLAISVLWYFADAINWLFVGASAAVCALLAGIWGEGFIEFLRDLWWWT